VPAHTYTVKRGDSLSRIANLLYRDSSRWRLLAQANHLRNPWLVYVGQSLIVPEPPTNPVDAGPAPKPVSSTMSEQRLAELAPPLGRRGSQLVTRCRDEGVAIRISRSLRTWPQQDALYAQGRTAPGLVVTYARGGESFHNFGLAFDIELLDSTGRPTWDARLPGWSIAGELGVGLGLRWGGHWKRSRDLPHFELRTQLTLEECRGLYPLGLSEIWKRVS
jgi:peptidoglycan LD-endopeptidase CwlK